MGFYNMVCWGCVYELFLSIKTQPVQQYHAHKHTLCNSTKHTSTPCATVPSTQAHHQKRIILYKTQPVQQYQAHKHTLCNSTKHTSTPCATVPSTQAHTSKHTLCNSTKHTSTPCATVPSTQAHTSKTYYFIHNICTHSVGVSCQTSSTKRSHLNVINVSRCSNAAYNFRLHFNPLGFVV
jgi:hypothetical protein